MTLTLELTPEVQSRLYAQAEAQGLSVEAYLQNVIQRLVEPEAIRLRAALSDEERAARIRALRGKYAHIGAGSEEFQRSKQEEIEREERLETIAGIKRGLEDVEAGRTRPLEEFDREMREKYGVSR